ncbi:MAG: hypothetical protein M9921_14460 [Fimbriimonadaceae bacterium]|nr:hypothetical protein [Chthonomonadaceae bacterium]MCO5298047.1 hypothetical protein [Fimbriimonadaceae bacterium]
MECNTGGPRSRTRTEHLHATVLGRGGGLRCPKLRHVGLKFEKGHDPVERMEALLERLGYRSALQAREALADRLPDEVFLAMPGRLRPTLAVNLRQPRAVLTDVLVEGLVLGLCSANLYDPGRPVLWTRASLTRRLDLFSVGGFYEAD